MINPQELRIGNLIQDAEFEIFEVSEISKDHIQAGALTIYRAGFLDDYGIPLTEYWLKAAGFTKQPVSWVKDISIWRPELKVLCVTLSQGVMIRCGELKKERHTDELIVLYNSDVRGPLTVHYIQNLFYSLTGTELTINR